MNKYVHKISQEDSSSSTQNSKSAIYFKSVCNAFEQAAHVAGKIDYYFNIGGLTIRLCFAGPALVSSLAPAFEHLSVLPVSTPDFSIFLWDSVSTGIHLPSSNYPWETNTYAERGERWFLNLKNIKIKYVPVNHTYSMIDKSSKIAVFKVESAEDLPQYDKGAPLLTILHWWMVDHDKYLIHAGAVGKDDGGALLIGKGGSGKSTVALSCLASDMKYVSDDYCLISNNSSRYAYSLYCSGKVNASDIKKFPFLNSAVIDSDDPETGKALYIFSKGFSEKISSGFPIRAILIPQVSNVPETRIEKATSAMAFRAVVPSTIFQLPGEENQSVKCLSEIVRHVPCYILNLGTDLTKISAVISEVL